MCKNCGDNGHIAGNLPKEGKGGKKKSSHKKKVAIGNVLKQAKEK